MNPNRDHAWVLRWHPDDGIRLHVCQCCGTVRLCLCKSYVCHYADDDELERVAAQDGRFPRAGLLL